MRPFILSFLESHDASDPLMECRDVPTLIDFPSRPISSEYAFMGRNWETKFTRVEKETTDDE